MIEEAIERYLSVPERVFEYAEIVPAFNAWFCLRIPTAESGVSESDGTVTVQGMFSTGFPQAGRNRQIRHFLAPHRLSRF